MSNLVCYASFSYVRKFFLFLVLKDSSNAIGICKESLIYSEDRQMIAFYFQTHIRLRWVKEIVSKFFEFLKKEKCQNLVWRVWRLLQQRHLLPIFCQSLLNHWKFSHLRMKLILYYFRFILYSVISLIDSYKEDRNNWSMFLFLISKTYRSY